MRRGRSPADQSGWSPQCAESDRFSHDADACGGCIVSFAAVVGFLLSDDASYLTGETISVDGGMA